MFNNLKRSVIIEDEIGSIYKFNPDDVMHIIQRGEYTYSSAPSLQLQQPTPTWGGSGTAGTITTTNTVTSVYNLVTTLYMRHGSSIPISLPLEKIELQIKKQIIDQNVDKALNERLD